MKRAGIIPIVLGPVIVVGTILADLLLQDGNESFGAFQFFGLEAGILILLTGIGLFTVQQNGEVSIWEQFRLLPGKIIDWPNIVWVFLAFLVVYIPFFLFP